MIYSVSNGKQPKFMGKVHKKQILKDLSKLPEGYKISPKGYFMKIKNVTLDFKKKDWQDLGFKGIGEGKKFFKEMKRNNIANIVKTKEEFKGLVNVARDFNKKAEKRNMINAFVHDRRQKLVTSNI